MCKNKLPSFGQSSLFKLLNVTIAFGFFSITNILILRFVFADALIADRTKGPRPAPTTITIACESQTFKISLNYGK